MIAETYYKLAKPGIIYGNALTAIGGFLLAAQGEIDFLALLSLIIGISLVVASACVFNNIADIDIDKKMSRTKNRALVTGLVSVKNARIYAIILGILGAVILAAGTNIFALALGLFGLFMYAVVYTKAKRTTVYSTLLGSIPGAVPVAAGYVAAAGAIDAAAVVLFAILVLWQMPHFYAIAMFRLEDYKAAGLPVLPLRVGMQPTKLQIVLYILGFIFAILLLRVAAASSTTYIIVMVALGLIWLLMGMKGFSYGDATKWAKKMFKFSLIVITAFSILIGADFVLP